MAEWSRVLLCIFIRGAGICSEVPRRKLKMHQLCLLTSTTYASVHAEYKTAAITAELLAMGYDYIRSLWHICCPDIWITQRQEGVCVGCEHFRAESKATKSEDERLELLTAWTHHIEPPQEQKIFKCPRPFQEYSKQFCHFCICIVKCFEGLDNYFV